MDKVKVISDILYFLPIRIRRLSLHFTYFIPFFHYKLPNRPSNPFIWALDFFFLTIDTLGIPEWITLFILIIKGEIRKLTDQEIELAHQYFHNKIDYSRVWVDPINLVGTKKFAHAYVLFNMINFTGNIKPDVFIHELVHIYQYQEYGSLYIGRALLAQRSRDGYNYGNGEGLYHAMVNGRKFKDFNFEQQGEILQHYYCIRSGKYVVGPVILSTYQYFVQDMLSDQ